MFITRILTDHGGVTGGGQQAEAGSNPAKSDCSWSRRSIRVKFARALRGEKDLDWSELC
jgi:hypothetical protein